MYIYKDDMYCECESKVMSVLPENPRLATAYVPFQHAKCIFSAERGLCEGSIFPDLVMPYVSPFDESGNVMADYDSMHCDYDCYRSDMHFSDNCCMNGMRNDPVSEYDKMCYCRKENKCKEGCL